MKTYTLLGSVNHLALLMNSEAMYRGGGDIQLDSIDELDLRFKEIKARFVKKSDGTYSKEFSKPGYNKVPKQKKERVPK